MVCWLLQQLGVVVVVVVAAAAVVVAVAAAAAAAAAAAVVRPLLQEGAAGTDLEIKRCIQQKQVRKQTGVETEWDSSTSFPSFTDEF